jgi:hypothetical protein
MAFARKHIYRIVGLIFGVAFLLLFSIRTGLYQKVFLRPQTLSLSSIGEVSERDSWMNIFQNDRKIGFSHTTFSREPSGYLLQETVYMRINTMGMVQDINIKTAGRLHPDFTIAELNFQIDSGRFRFVVEGTVSGNVLSVQTESAGDRRKMDFKIPEKTYLMVGIMNAVASAEFEPGQKFVFQVFDPATMGQQPVFVEVIGPEDIEIKGIQKRATKISLSLKGATQLAWIDDTGDVLKEKGLLGVALEKTDRHDALYGVALESSEDLTQTASVPSNMIIKDLDKLDRLRLEISGISLPGLRINGGRQSFKDPILEITRESLSGLPEDLNISDLGELEKVFLRPSPFIQSDNQKIQDLADEIVGAASPISPLEKLERLVGWVHQNIEKRPVLSMPDALSTLENRMGDCNEHAMLLAALARAAGIPCRVEAGLVYLRGRFYYHAWNLAYLGRWITIDALFGQIPADVSHIRFVTGSQQNQLDLMGLIGRIQISVIKQ